MGAINYKRIIKFLRFRKILFESQLKYRIRKFQAKNGILKKEIQGSTMLLDLKDKGLSRDLIVDGVREPLSTKEISKVVKKGDIVVDIGANIGYYVLMESKIVGNTGKIYAIEPSPQNIKCLKKNVAVNNYSNIEVYDFAIGDVIGVKKMNISSHYNLNTLVSKKDNRITGTVDVNTSTLDKFLTGKKFPSFVRMDVEGYEYNIIKGMKNILSSKKPINIFIELHPHIMKKEQTEYILKKLADSGFKAKKIIRSITVPEMKVMDKEDYDYSHKNIGDLLKDRLFLEGKLGAFEIFFVRN